MDAIGNAVWSRLSGVVKLAESGNDRSMVDL